MEEWTRCAACGLRHRITVAERCPRCGAAASVPTTPEPTPPAGAPAVAPQPPAAPAGQQAPPPAPPGPSWEEQDVAPGIPWALLGGLAGLAVLVGWGFWAAFGPELGPHRVTTRGMLRLAPSAASLIVPRGEAGPRDNLIGWLGAGEEVEVLERAEPWARVRGDGGREGWTEAVRLVPRATQPALVLHPTTCLERPLLSKAGPRTLSPGETVHVGRSVLGRWSVRGVPGCGWVEAEAVTLEEESLQAMRQAAQAHRQGGAAGRAALAAVVERYAQVEAAALLTDPDALVRVALPVWEPSSAPVRALAASVRRPQEAEDEGWLPTPQRPPGPAPRGDPGPPAAPLTILPAAAPGTTFVWAELAEPLGWDQVPDEHLPAHGPPEGGVGARFTFRIPPPAGVADGHAYLVTGAGVAEVEPAAVEAAIVYELATSAPALEGRLMLRPGQGGGQGFVLVSEEPADFSARTLHLGRHPKDLVDGTALDLRQEPDGEGTRLTLVEEDSARSVFVERPPGPIGRLTEVVAFPGGRFLLVEWGTRGRPGGCADATLHRWLDLVEVAASTCHGG